MESNGILDVSLPYDTDAGSAAPQEETLAVKVAVHIRPLIGAEQYQGCKDCTSVVPGEPQVQIGNHSFTFDHVYGSAESSSSAIFEECVSPLVEGLFHGYNATVLAYGQTGSGKTYTMGTGYTVGGSTEGIIPQVMDMIFKKVGALKEKAELQLRVSFIEILKEEVHDLLDPNPPIMVKTELINGFGSKSGAPGKPPIQIRENTNGGITLAGVAETDVSSLEEMAACLEQGSLCRATASTNMNSRSSRSHAIFTITVEQKHKENWPTDANSISADDAGDDFLCAKLHLVDLAGSERAKRTGADGIRFKEGVHINRGLLALGNVISALGDDKKRKEGGHVPYRDSKLTRLLQDSLGGNSRTVMIACISPADSNAEETLNTLKYANRARNIQNKPVVNRDPMAAEMHRIRQQVELLQAELLCARAGGSIDEIQILKKKTAWLEATLVELRRELQEGAQRTIEAQVERDKLQLKLDLLRNGKSWEDLDHDKEHQGVGLLESYAAKIKELEIDLQQLRDAGSQAAIFSRQQTVLSSRNSPDIEVSNLDLPDVDEGDEAGEMEEEAAEKEMEHTRLQDTMDKELQELNKRLEQKEAEMKVFVKCDGVVLKQHFEKKILELEEEKKSLQRERDALVAQLASLANASDEQSQKLHEASIQKVKALETQIAELKKKQENQAQLLKQKQRSDEAAKRLQEEIQRIKTHKVQLQNKMKQESEHFRTWKASREKEVLQLKKEGRRNEFEMHKLQALNQRQKMVLQRKTEEAALATRRLKELLEARKPSPRENLISGASSGNKPGGQANEKALQQWLNHELEVAVNVHEVRSNYEKQTHSRTALAKELAKLQDQQDIQTKQFDVSKFAGRSSSGVTPAASMSPSARQAKIALLESMLNASSSTLVAMASQLSEAEERERAFSGRARWQHLRSMGDAKNLLQHIFNSAADARCRYWDKELENKELKEKILELTELLRQNESHRKESDRQQIARDQYITRAIASSMKLGTNAALKSCMEEISKHLLQLNDVPPRNVQYPDSHSDVSSSENGGFPHDLRKVSRNLQSSTPSTDPDSSEISEGESDMDIDEDNDDDGSDEDWGEGVEKRHLKSRVRKNKGDKGPTGLQGDNTEHDKRPTSCSQLCCSCSKKSGCKTSKCECKATSGLCGANCACSIKKCANRDENFEASEIAEAMETLRLDKALKETDTESKAIDHAISNGNARSEEVMRAEQVLARHGASLLDDVWNDEIQPVNSAAKTDHKREDQGNPRKPLADIGNTKVSEAEDQPKTKQRKRWKKAVLQLLPAAPPSHVAADPVSNRQHPDAVETRQHDIPPTDAAIETASSDMPVVTSSSNATKNEPEELVPNKVPRNARKRLSPPSSPLRARNTHSGSAEEIKKLGNSGSCASPRGPGRGSGQEKENV